MGYVHSHQRHACLPHLLNAEELHALRNCSLCGVDSELHRVERNKLPQFPSRSTSMALCSSEDDQHDDPATSSDLMARYEQAEQTARRAALDACVCTVHGTGRPEEIEMRHFPNGLSHVTQLCSFGQSKRRRIDFHPLERSVAGARVGTAHGGKHLIIAGTMSGSGRDVVIRIAMHPNPPSSRMLDGCTVVEDANDTPRLHCGARTDADAAYRSMCAARLGGGGTTNGTTHHNDMFDLRSQAALDGLPGFPSLLGGGCCLYALDNTTTARLLVLPIELRLSFFPRARDPSSGLLAEVDIDTTVPLCEHHKWDLAACALHRALLTARMFEELHEGRHRAILGEFVDASDEDDGLEGADPSNLTCGEITQLCWDGHTGQLALCDTDFIALVPPSHNVPLPFSTSVSDRVWGRATSSRATSKASREGRVIDMPCAFARSVLRPWVGLLPWLAPLIAEIGARHKLLGEGVKQLSFSCIGEWMRWSASLNTDL